MLTPQDIKEKEFSKAVFGGYDMGAVDDFLEEIEKDYTALYKDNAVLKGKLKVLVDKVEEYRSTEDAMRMALLTAQRMSDDMMEDARKKCEEMIAAAEREANSKRTQIEQDTSAEERRLAAAQAETAKFIAASQKLVEEHANFLSKVTELTGELIPPAPDEASEEPAFSPEPERGSQPAAKPAAEENPTGTDAETLRDIDSFVSDIMEENSKQRYEQVSLDETRRVPDAAEISEELKKAEAKWSEEDEETTPRPKFKFDDLQFGTNYDGDKK